MEVYIFTLLLIFVLGYFDLRLELTNSQRSLMIFFLYLFIVIQIGLRWETGTDWNMYIINFDTTYDYAIVLLNTLTGFEIGYGTFVFIVKKIWDNYSFFLLLHALVFYWGIFRMAKKYSPYFFISIMFYYANNLGIVGSNRQLLAIVICLWSLEYVFERKVYKFFLTVFAAMLFHTTAFLFIIYYFLNRNFKTIVVISVLIGSFIIGKTALPFYIFSKFGGMFGELATTKTSYYSNTAQDALAEGGLGIAGLIKRLLFVVVFTYNYSFLSEKLNYYKLLYNGYVFGIVMYFLFSSSLLIFVSRGSLYFNIMESLLISCQFLIFYNRLDKVYLYIALLLLSIVFIFQSIAIYPDLFNPYKSLFYNVNYSRYLY